MNNFHTHTYLCKHAVGKPIDYAKVANEHNFTELGFSDHCPYPNDALWLSSHMSCDEQPLYHKMVVEAKEAVNIPIYFGYECEWHPRFKNWYSDELIHKYGSDYLIYGSHWIDKGNEFIYVPEIIEKQDLIRYVDLTIEGMGTGLFSYLAHPDLFLSQVSNLTPFYIDLSKKIIDASIELKIPLEINGNGCKKPQIERDGKMEYVYPVKKFWQMANERNAHIIIAADAHAPKDLIENLEMAEKFAKDLDINYDKDYVPKFFSY